MSVLPPGTLLQLMYLRERLQRMKVGRFIEIGPGSGEIARLLLDLGWAGQSCDLDSVTVGRLRIRFAKEIAEGRYRIECTDFLSLPVAKERYELVISCMVMEHLDERVESMFMMHSAAMLDEKGAMAGLVPGSPRHWGIEDEIAGHYRRYSVRRLEDLACKTNWELGHVAGLTFPLSNFLLPISNLLVRMAESAKLNLSTEEQTRASGRRRVWFKTHFPNVLGLVLNRYLLAPFHWLQKAMRSSDNALVIYFEAKPRPRSASV